MSDDNTITPLHLQTMEAWMAQTHAVQMQTSESMKETNRAIGDLAKSVNELVIAERLRTESDSRIREQMIDIKGTQDKYIDDVKWLAKVHKNWDNYVTKILVPIIITGIIVAIATSGGFAIFAGGK